MRGREKKLWVGCSRCDKWRRLPTVEEGEKAGEIDDWHCGMNPDSQYNSCDIPQNGTDEEIDRRIAEDEGEEEEEGSPTAIPGSGTDGGDEEEEEEEVVRPVVQKVNRNVFFHRLPKQLKEDDVPVCDCKAGADCGPGCLNRGLLMECSARFCPCGESCQNQRFKRAEYAKLGVMKAGKKGHGLQALQDLKKGQFIIEYVGEVLDEETYAQRKRTYLDRGQRHYYFMNLTTSEVIDATAKGNMGRFVNHSCSPNCETQKWTVDGEICIGLFAKEDIKAMSELTFDYNFERYGDTAIRCYCESPNCKKWIGGTGDGTPPEEEEEEDDSDLEDEPEPILLESDGAELKAFEIAAAKAAKAEEERKRRVAEKRQQRVLRRAAKEEAAAARRKSNGASVSRVVQRRSTGAKPFVKRTEVDRRMDELRGNDGGLKDKESAVSLLRLFSLAMQGEAGRKSAHPGSGASQKDLSILLSAIESTKKSAVLQALVDANASTVFHMALTRLRGDFDSTGVIRKMLGVMNKLPLQLAHLEKSHTAAKGGSLLALLDQLRREKDDTVTERARELLEKVRPAKGAGRPSVGMGQGQSNGNLAALGGTPVPGQQRAPTPVGEGMGPGGGRSTPQLPPPPLHTPPGQAGPPMQTPPGPPGSHGRGEAPGAGPPGFGQQQWGPPVHPMHANGHAAAGPSPPMPRNGVPPPPPPGGMGMGMGASPHMKPPHQRPGPPGPGPTPDRYPPPHPHANGSTPAGHPPQWGWGAPAPGSADRRAWSHDGRQGFPPQDDRDRGRDRDYDYRDPKRLRLSDGPGDHRPPPGPPMQPPPHHGGPPGPPPGPPGRGPEMGYGGGPPPQRPPPGPGHGRPPGPPGPPPPHPGDGGPPPPGPPAPPPPPPAPRPPIRELPPSLPDVRTLKSELERVPPHFDNPLDAPFARAVEVMVALRVGKYRQKEHPLYIPLEADAVRLADRITAKIVEKEREHFGEKREPVLREKLQEKIAGFVRESVQAFVNTQRP